MGIASSFRYSGSGFRENGGSQGDVKGIFGERMKTVGVRVMPRVYK